MLNIRYFHKILFIIIGLFFIIFIYNFISEGLHFEKIHKYFEEIGLFKLLISSLLYLFSHFLRSLRISVMLEKQDFSLISLAAKQYYSNAVNIIVPFKLGEVYRIVEINKLVKDFNTTFITVVAERSIDFFILFCGLFFSLMIENYQLFQLRYTVAIGVIFICSVLFIYFVLPENIRSINLFLAKRHKGKFIISYLSFTTRFNNVIINLREIFRKRYSTIILLSLLIWGCDLCGFIFLVGILNLKLSFLLAFLVFLSSLIHSGTIGFGGFQLAFYIISTLEPSFPFLEMSYLYQFLIFGPALVIGIVIYIFLIARHSLRFRKAISIK